MVDSGSLELNSISRRIIGAAIEVHRVLGPGLLESVYETCLLDELAAMGFSTERQKSCPIIYKDRPIKNGFRLDILVENQVVIECKAIEELLPLHYAQVLTYLRLTDLKLGLILNFNRVRLKDGIARIVNGLNS